jgi:hypothetical protein
MPLVTDNIEEARIAYLALEQRARSTDQLVQDLKSALDDLQAGRFPAAVQTAGDLSQVVLNLEAANASLRAKLEQAILLKADLPLQNFIASLGLAAAVGEATMPDRTIPSLSAMMRTYLTLSDSGPGFRFFQPGVDQDSSPLTTTTIEIAKVPPHAGTAAPRNLYSVLQDKQGLYTRSFWASFKTSGTSPSQPASDIVSAIATAFADTGSWNFVYLVRLATTVGTLEKNLSALVAATTPGANGAAYEAAASSLLALTRALTNKALPVVGDFLALVTSIDYVTGVARSLVP